MNFKYINKFLLIIIIFFFHSCKTIEKFSKENDKNISKITINDNIESNESISLKKNNHLNKLFLDFYSDDYNSDIYFNKDIKKKLTINNFKKSYDNDNPIKVYLINNFIYGIDNKSNFNIFNIEDGKLIKSIKLFELNKKNLPTPTSFSFYNENFIIGFRSGKIININKDGELIWEYEHDKILSTPIKIYKNNIIALYGNTIKFISIENGNEILSEIYEGSEIINARGGKVKHFANILYFILPNSSLGQIDSFFYEKTYSNFTLNNYQDSINNAYDEIHVFDNYISYFDDRLNLYSYDIYLDKFILSQKRISDVNSFKFFNNSLIVKSDNSIKAYNIKNGKIFWSHDIKKIVKDDVDIVNIKSFNNEINIFFENGMVLIIDDKQIKDIINLKLKNINLLYLQNNKMFFSHDNGKTTIF